MKKSEINTTQRSIRKTMIEVIVSEKFSFEEYLLIKKASNIIMQATHKMLGNRTERIK